MDIDNKKRQPLPDMPSTAGAAHTSTFLVAAIAAVITYLLLRFRFTTAAGDYHHIILKMLLALGMSCFVLAGASFIQRMVVKRSRQKYLKYNLLQVIRLVSVLIVVFIFVSFLFQNWYTAAVSLGLISLLLGFALQTPISSFIGWVYIIFRSPYHIGDRIQLSTFKGDVVEIGYLDTTLWEFGGDYLTNDVPSGRLIRFPNSLVLQSAVTNYSWAKFPYIWNEIPFHIAYESDLEFITTTLVTVANNELGPAIRSHINELKQLVKETPVDELEIQECPFVSFRTNANTWIEATLTYLVPPKKASAIRTAILQKSVAELLKQPDKVMFPKSNAR
ncbi:MAG: mechanosensitive ion channel family protein [Ferruginibacter sp.]|uniref:mechanosensitive ion channel family protein n=1 Tax=Ferruginibacter sp. TaxID=1940288 RepID=UPI002657E798|nr:mechanosensitive ion channel domain-containing protein [Ferruginibacter sp.]MDB5278603.1 mechanosensitive ion channel family protein [Ferruginibacter sp.]